MLFCVISWFQKIQNQDHEITLNYTRYKYTDSVRNAPEIQTGFLKKIESPERYKIFVGIDRGRTIICLSGPASGKNTHYAQGGSENGK